MKQIDLQKRKALVTGSATGLGRSISVALAECGADIVVNYSRSESDAMETADLCRAAGADVVVVRADVSKEEGAKCIAEAIAPWERLDILVNNAGITKHAPNHADLGALSRDDFINIYLVNTVAPFLVIKACEPLLNAGYEFANRSSAVLNVSSIAGVTGIGSSVAYAASKGALNTITLSLARALSPRIRVNAICPGFIATRWFKDQMSHREFEALQSGVVANTPLMAASSPEDIASAALFLVSDASKHITGEHMLVDAGLHLASGA